MRAVHGRTDRPGRCPGDGHRPRPRPGRSDRNGARLRVELQASAPDRFVVGLGGLAAAALAAGTAPLPGSPRRCGPPVPAEHRILTALGPRKLAIARTRCAGAVALLVTPAYTSQARTIVGNQSTLVIDQFVVLDSDPRRARQTARKHLNFLSGVPGYRANFARMGFTDSDISEMSPHLVDELVAWG